MTSDNRTGPSPEFALSPMPPDTKKLRRHLFRLLRQQGFRLGPDYQLAASGRSKRKIRALHSHFRQDRLGEERKFIQKWFPRISKYFASGSDVDPTRVDPYPVLVDEDDELAALFRVGTLWWSIPVSKGYGRRFRILVFDRSNGKLFGLLALADPVFNLRKRDSWIGWNVRTREQMLAHVMDAYVLGAVPPYNSLLGAKFVSLLAASDFTRHVFRRRYHKTRSVILERSFDGRLALVTTTSALGRSSILNRLRYDGSEVFHSLGLTEGFGHFHLANGTFQKIRSYLDARGIEEVDRYKYGSGPNYRMRVVRKALEALQLPSTLLRHGVQRGVYAAPLAQNTVAFLRGEVSRLKWHDRPLDGIVRYWRERWLLPRAVRDKSYLDFKSDSWAKILELEN
jgi:hypothetical protein